MQSRFPKEMADDDYPRSSIKMEIGVYEAAV